MTAQWEEEARRALAGLVVSPEPIIEGLSKSPDPVLAGRGLVRLVFDGAEGLADALDTSPEFARTLSYLLGSIRELPAILHTSPDLIAWLAAPLELALPTATSLATEAEQALADHGSADGRWILREFRQREQLRVAVADMLRPTVGTAGHLTNVADAIVNAALNAVSPRVPFVVVAMGSLGGRELSFASDLDLLFVYEGASIGDLKEAERIVVDVRRLIAGESRFQWVYDVDMSLRPWGRRDRMLARSVDTYCAYHAQNSHASERQALLLARAVAGDGDVAKRFMEVIEPVVWCQRLPGSDTSAIRNHKRRMEHRDNARGSARDLKQRQGSLSDVGWTTRLLQLQNGVRATGTREGLRALAEVGAVAAEDFCALMDAYGFCERLRNRSFLLNGSAIDPLPRRTPDPDPLARSLGMTSQELRECCRSVTSRARAVVERLFYGEDERWNAA